MDSRQRHELDRHITGNWGEDSVGPDEEEIMDSDTPRTEHLDRIEEKLREMAAGPYSCKPLFDDLALVRQEMADLRESAEDERTGMLAAKQEIDRLREIIDLAVDIETELCAKAADDAMEYFQTSLNPPQSYAMAAGAEEVAARIRARLDAFRQQQAGPSIEFDDMAGIEIKSKP